MNPTLAALAAAAAAQLLPASGDIGYISSSTGKAIFYLIVAVLVCLLVALVAYLVAAPRLYRRRLEKRGPRSLTAFLMRDPQTRDLVMPKKNPPANSDAEPEEKTGP